jgi:hypothetical protein
MEMGHTVEKFELYEGFAKIFLYTSLLPPVAP